MGSKTTIDATKLSFGTIAVAAIRISTGERYTELTQGYRLGALGYHPSTSEAKWTVTHLVTGGRVCDFECADTAQAFVRKFGYRKEWNLLNGSAVHKGESDAVPNRSFLSQRCPAFLSLITAMMELLTIQDKELSETFAELYEEDPSAYEMEIPVCQVCGKPARWADSLCDDHWEQYVDESFWSAMGGQRND